MDGGSLVITLALVTLLAVVGIVAYQWRSARSAQKAHGEKPGEAIAQEHAAAPGEGIGAAVQAETDARAAGKPMRINEDASNL